MCSAAVQRPAIPGLDDHEVPFLLKMMVIKKKDVNLMDKSSSDDLTHDFF